MPYLKWMDPTSAIWFDHYIHYYICQCSLFYAWMILNTICLLHSKIKLSLVLKYFGDVLQICCVYCFTKQSRSSVDIKYTRNTDRNLSALVLNDWFILKQNVCTLHVQVGAFGTLNIQMISVYVNSHQMHMALQRR